MKKPALLLLPLIACASYSASAHETDHWDQYETLATNISKTVKTAPLDKLTKQSIELTQLSTQLIPAFIEQHPICKGYLTAALGASNKMTSLSLEDIEKDYHADGKLPAVKSAKCYHAKDLLVHPATMAVIGKTQQDTKQTRQQMADELEEVLEHFNQVKSAAGI
ncbi:hypothetical protein tloyanaT_30970 [Thalassotalea loyana]|uniref:Uncharacterized protein n=1 Tax=Thalassotalea loyana TaxID=280483 RepID=A0ABQ6HGT8_9GAMM|nr:hypothetical protein [Thalassotalea loyana]GLX86844.1 hypothetical protein tloyanaT_30970 [Thalassotalea loyana]